MSGYDKKRHVVGYRCLCAWLIAAVFWVFTESAYSQTQIDALSTNSGTSNLFSHLHTVSGANRLLLVAVEIENNGSVQGVTFGGQLLTLLNRHAHSPNQKPVIEVWQMADPPVTTDSIQVTMSGGVADKVVIGAISYTGVNTAAPIDTVVTAFGTGPDPSIVIKTKFGTYFQDFLTSLSVGIPVAGPDQIVQWALELGGPGATGFYGTSSSKLGQDSTTMTWSLAELNKDWLVTAVSIIPDPSPVLDTIGSKTVDENVPLNFNVSASDSDGTIPTLSVQNVPANSSFTDNGNGTGSFSFTPDFTQAGSYDVLFMASDSSQADSEIVNITVNNINRAPVISPIADTLVAEGSNLSFKVFSTDPDGDIADLTAAGLPVNALFIDENDGTGTFVFMPNYTQAGVYSISFIASDGALSDTATVQIIVTNVSPIAIDEVLITAIPIGFSTIVPAESNSLILAFRLHNFYSTPMTVTSLTIRDASRGPGTPAQRLQNVVQALLYNDKNANMYLDEADSLLAIVTYASGSNTFTGFNDTIPPGGSHNLLVAVNSSLFPRDRDTLDVYLYASSDITFATVIAVSGFDSVNSYGFGVFDGMTAKQIGVVPAGLTTISPSDSLEIISIFDIPRNGYAGDTLQVFNLLNLGTAQSSDFDSLVVFKDNGNLSFDGAPGDTRVGRLIFTGGQWTVSGVAMALTAQLNRVYVAARVSQFPNNGATFRGAIAQNGIQMNSGNDGPYDSSAFCPDTITIQNFESIDIEIIPQAGINIIPGQSAGKLLAWRLTNSFSIDIALDSLTLSLLAVDPQGATQFQLDSQIDSIVLHHETDGDISSTGINDSVLASATVFGGVAVLDIGGLNISAFGGTEVISAELFLDLRNAKNGNLINLAMDSTADVFTSPAVTVSGAFPLSNPQNYTIDAFPAAAVSVNAIPGKILFAGQNNRAVLNFRLPGNGYANDSLRTIQITNVGTLDERNALARVRLYLDLLNDGLTIDDRPLGLFVNKTFYWELTNLTQLIRAAGASFLVTVDVANGNFDGGTLDFQIPLSGVIYKSLTDGPDDVQVGNPNSHLVFPANRITAISIPAPTINILPGSVDNGILTFALYNGYIGKNQNLQGLILTNSSNSVSSATYADYEMGQVALYADNNNNRIRDNDSLIATGVFSSGKLQFTGLNELLPAESLSYFFVEINIPLNVIDSDSLAATIGSLGDLFFEKDVVVNGEVPISSNGYRVINGSVFNQYQVIGVTPTTLRPGDSMIPVYAFRPAFNGNQSDTLQILSVSNVGSADNTDISSLTLWRDLNSDDTWQLTDSLLGTFTYAAGSWSVGSLGLRIDSSIGALFVLASIDSLATNGTTFRGQIPLNGCRYSSANDGPIDKPATGDDEFTISASGLRVALQPLAGSFSVGQTIPVKLQAINLNIATLDAVSGTIVAILDSTIVSLDSSFAGPVTLNPGDTGMFSFFFSADFVGSTNWSLRAVDAVSAESSAVLQTPLVTIQTIPNNVPVSFINSIPTAVTKGQLNVFPMSLKITHPDSSGTTAAIRIDSLRLLVEDGANNPIAANTALSGLVLSSGFQTISIINTVPAQSGFWLVFNQSVIIQSGASRTFSLLVDIDTNATAANFALAITDASFIPLADDNSGQSIGLSPSLTFPMRTASCRIEDPSKQLAVSSQSIVTPLVNYGQQDVGILQINLKHPAAFGSSQIQLTAVAFEFLDTSGAPLIASELYGNIAIVRQQVTVGDLFGNVPANSRVNLTLNSPITLSPGEVVSIQIQADMLSSSAHDGFSLTILDSTEFVVRELSSGTPISAVTDTVVFSTGSAFPMYSAIAEMRQPAQAPQFCISSNLPPSVISGVDSLSLIGLTLVYSAANNFSPLRLNQLSLSVKDTSGTILDPDRVFDRIGYSRSAGTVVYQPFVQIFGSSVIFKFEDTGLVINPGDSFQLNLIADLEADVPYDHFVLRVEDTSSLILFDATDTTNLPGVLFAAGCGSSFPFATSMTKVFLAAGKPTLSISQYPVQITFPGQSNLLVLDGFLDYQSATPQGDLSINGVIGRLHQRNGNSLVPVSAAQVFSSVALELGGVPVAVDSVLAIDSIFLTLGTPYSLSRGEMITTVLRVNVKSAAVLGNYVIIFDDSVAFDIEDSNLGTSITPLLAGLSYPLKSVEISVVAADLGSSFTNYPNPFNPARGEQTTIGFVLTEAGYVNIEIYSITGESVKEVTLKDFRSSGTYQSDFWRGVNDVGLNVLPGTYFCRIYVKYVSGREEEFKRKIAVVR